MPTNKKWDDYVGHYALEGGANEGTTLLDDIQSLPHWKGIQRRFTWKDFEGATPGSYNFDLLTNPTTGWFKKCADRGKKLRILFMYKAFGGNAVPAYISKTPTDTGYNPIYTDGTWYGTYKWGGVSQCAALWIPAVADRLIALLQAMAAAVDTAPELATIDLNETSFGNPSPALTSAQKTAYGQQMARIIEESFGSFSKTCVGWFINFPPSVFPVMLPKLIAVGGNLAGPDVWFHDTSLESGIIQDYYEQQGVIPICPSVQNPDYQHYNHDEQSSSPPVTRTDIPMLKLFNRVTLTPDTFNTANITGGLKQPLKANFTAWSAIKYPIPGHANPWNDLKAVFAAEVAPGGRYPGSDKPGITTTIPSKLETGTSLTQLPALTASLGTDTGVLSTDAITNSVTITTSTPATGATLEYRKGASGAWSTTLPTPDEGANTFYVRQKKTGFITSDPSNGVTFQYSTTAPSRLMATIDDNVVLVSYSSFFDLVNTSTHRPDKARFTLAQSGGTPPTITGQFVNETGRNLRLDLGSNAVAGGTYTLSYAPLSTGTAKLQDKAGNEAPAFSGISLINITGTGSPTQVVTVAGIPGVSSSGGYTNLRNWTVSGTLSDVLQSGDQLQIDRAIGASGSFVNMGYASVSGTNWTFVDNGDFADGVVKYRGKVRRGIGSKVGPLSAEFSINVLSSAPIDPPSIAGGTFLNGSNVVITGSWTPVAGHVVTVAFNGVSYGTGNGLVIDGGSFSLSVAGVPVGVYTIAARVTDPAGNFATSEDNVSVSVIEQPTKSNAALAFARRV
jgi:hypothetical protein